MPSTDTLDDTSLEDDLNNEDKQHYICLRCRPGLYRPGMIVTAECGALFRLKGTTFSTTLRDLHCPDCVAAQVAHGH